jgi:hypothetical protein
MRVRWKDIPVRRAESSVDIWPSVDWELTTGLLL